MPEIAERRVLEMDFDPEGYSLLAFRRGPLRVMDPLNKTWAERYATRQIGDEFRFRNGGGISRIQLDMILKAHAPSEANAWFDYRDGDFLIIKFYRIKTKSE